MQDKVVFGGDCNLSVPFDGDMNALINVMQGMETETGEWIPETSVQRGSIAFAKTHADTPAIILLWDTTKTATPLQVWSGKTFSFVDYEKLYGSFVRYGTDGTLYGVARAVSALLDIVVRPDGSVEQIDSVEDSLNRKLWYSSTLPPLTNYYPRYYATEEGFMPLAGTSPTYTWLQGRTYKWIAIWA